MSELLRLVIIVLCQVYIYIYHPALSFEQRLGLPCRAEAHLKTSTLRSCKKLCRLGAKKGAARRAGNSRGPEWSVTRAERDRSDGEQHPGAR